ncbi:DUF881 domain-containing protein [Clostridiaceae bacterium 35-E11]
MKLGVWKLNILILCILLGFLISLQVKSVNKDYRYVPLKDIYDYKLSIESEKKEIENIRKIFEERKKRIGEYERIKEEGGILKETMKKELQNIKMISGFLDVQGSGIILTVDDGTRQLYEGEDPNNVLVHDIDVLNLINDLKVAGAEAISINGQRLLATSEINCAGHTIRINDQVFAQPFIIKAIGEPKTLEAAIVAPGQYGELLKEYGLYVEVNTSINLTIPKYTEELKSDYLKVYKEGE